MKYIQKISICAIAIGAWYLLNGYEFGIIDHEIHLPYLLRTLDPTFAPHDLMVNNLNYHPTLFWILQVPLVRLFPIEAVYFALHALAIGAMFYGTAALATALYPGKREGEWAAAIAVALVLVVKGTPSGIGSMDDYFIPRVASLGPLLYALALGVRRRYGAAFLLAGAVFNIHPTTTSHAAAMLWLAACSDSRDRRWCLMGPCYFLLAALPLLVMMETHVSTSGVPFPAPNDWWSLMRQMTWYHHFPSAWGYREWIRLCSPFCLLIAALRRRMNVHVVAYVAAIGLLCAIAFVSIELVGYPAALELHLWESTRFLIFLAAAYGSGWIALSWGQGGLRRLAAVVAGIGFSFDIWPMTMLAAAIEIKPRSADRPAKPLPGWLGPALIASVVVLCLSIFKPVGEERSPLTFTYRARPPAVMLWARDHLPSDALVVVPPTYEMGMFRFFARRGILASYWDGFEGAFSLEFAYGWRRRMEALCGCRPFDPGLFPNDKFLRRFWLRLKMIDDGYRQADAGRFYEMADLFGATHALVDAQATQPDLPLEYSDSQFRLYRIEKPRTAAVD